jgi:general secretion pathway protein E
MLLGPLGAIQGFASGVFASIAIDVPLIIFGPLTTMAGFGIMYVITHLETMIRIHGRADHGPRALAAEIGMDLVGGSLLGVMVVQMAGTNGLVALTAGASIVAFAGWMRRIFVGGWIDDAVRVLTLDGRDGQAPDYSKERELIAEGRIDEAVVLFETKSAERGGHPEPLVTAAQILRDRGRFKVAVELYGKALDAPDLDARRAGIFARQIWEIFRENLDSEEESIPYLEALVGRFPDAPEVEWAWKELTVGMTVTQAAEDHLGAHSAHVPAVRAVQKILSEAFVSHASDIHLEDYADGLRIRYRIDGVLQDVEAPPRRIRAAVLARLRVMAGLNPAESPLPQDARLRIPFAGRDVDIRLSTVPTLHGESMALRILDTERGRLELEGLGFRATDMDRLMEVVARPNGMVLATGPGGSGKSTTLHAVVHRISSGREKIFTIEDPVEYGLEGVCQVSVNQKSGLTFARLLRSLVRQDPDVLLVGEIRDTETAEVATHASLTGHLVLSTLHTTDAISALHRLVDIGVPDYMVIHTLEASLAQRLVRRICPQCAEDRELEEWEAEALGWNGGPTVAKTGRGCDRCRGTGYRGRIGIFELLLVDDPLRQAFLGRASYRELLETAKAGGMWTLRQDGAEKVRQGVTTPEEVLRVTTN